MSVKHFISDASVLINSALESLTLTNPSIGLDSVNKIVYRHRRHGDVSSSSSSSPPVSVISGGGSGHEPSFGGLVGDGLLAAAVAGSIFASPSAEQIRRAIMSRVERGRGVLVAVMNYTGDVLNFGLAVEKARAAGVAVEMVVVGDDVAVGRARGGKVGRRGIAGTVLVHKIAGALAALGYSLQDVYKVASLTAENLVSVGASLDHVHVPGRAAGDGTSKHSLGADEIEVGMGIHNEAGSERAVLDLPGLVKKMLAQLLDQNDADRAFVHVNSNEPVLLVNSLGGVSVLELGAITTEVVKQLRQTWAIRPVRILSGTYMTSLNSPGFSISLLNVVNTNVGGPSMIQLLDFPTEATGWAAPISKTTWEAAKSATREEDDASRRQQVPPSGLKVDASTMTKALTAGLEAVIAAESDVTRYDTVVGDGDCGIGLKRGAEAVLQHLSKQLLTGDLVLDLSAIVSIVESEMDGTCGALYAIFLNALLRSLQTPVPDHVSTHVWAAALKQSCAALSQYTPARPGDRTLIDALYPFVHVLEETGDVKKAAQASRAAAEGTKGMKASLGRTVYIGSNGFEHVPDPGAWALACFFMGLAGVQSVDSDWEAV